MIKQQNLPPILAGHCRTHHAGSPGPDDDYVNMHSISSGKGFDGNRRRILAPPRNHRRLTPAARRENLGSILGTREPMDGINLPAMLGGIGLFLLGMTMMTDGLKLAVGPAFSRLLHAWTATRWRGPPAKAPRPERPIPGRANRSLARFSSSCPRGEFFYATHSYE